MKQLQRTTALPSFQDASRAVRSPGELGERSVASELCRRQGRDTSPSIQLRCWSSLHSREEKSGGADEGEKRAEHCGRPENAAGVRVFPYPEPFKCSQKPLVKILSPSGRA